MNAARKQHADQEKFKLGITIGDINGIGPEIILKTFADTRMYDFCTPVVYGSTKALNYYKKALDLNQVNYQTAKYYNDELELADKVLNVVNCWDEIVEINMGEPSDETGKFALVALNDALTDLNRNMIDGIVTAPLNKATVKPEEGTFNGHTDYIAEKTGGTPLMILHSDNMRVGLVTGHIPIKEVADSITSEGIVKKLKILNTSLQQDFGINGPKIAVLGLNPHAGDDGLLGKEEKEIIAPAIEQAKEKGILAFGPYPADGIMGSGQFRYFDALLAMYHDQGLVAFKSVNFGTGVNYTAGLPIVRTSPDHGTGYDIAGKGEANEGSFRKAVFAAVDVLRKRKQHAEDTANPLTKRSKSKQER